MIEVFPFAGYPVAVFGLGRSGLSAARALMSAGAEVWAWDDDEGARSRAAAAGIPLVNLYLCNWSELPSLILSPGIALHHPEPHAIVKLARTAGCEVIGDIELLGRTMRESAYIGITGTNGKSTTTALIGHIMQVAGREAEIGGNLGVPALDLMPLGQDGTFILEMSSYQLELTVSITFDIAVLLNISADHLDRHGDIAGYIAAKKTIFSRQTKPRTAVIGVDDDYCRAIYAQLRETGDQNVVPISGLGPIKGGVYVDDGILIDDTEGTADRIVDLGAVATLPGVHNWQNAAAAYAVVKAAGVAPQVIMACIQSYPGLVHRQELLSVIDGTAYVNDSKATNLDATARALASYANIYWIAGGRAKGVVLEGNKLGPVADQLDRVRHGFLIGEAMDDFADALDGKVALEKSKTLDVALKQAHAQVKADAIDGAVVLLSPACASFDQFADFEDRGNAFRDLVDALPGVREEDLL